MSGIFKAYDIRGKYPEDINEDAVEKIARAYFDYLKPAKIVVGYDSRLSSPRLAESFCRACLERKASVTDIGMVTTPMLYQAIIDGNYDGGVMVTASHLPRDMNGLKLCRRHAVALSGQDGLPEIEEEFRHAEGRIPKTNQSKNWKTWDYLGQYLDKMSRFVHDPCSRRLVIDASNGSAGPEIRGILERVPAWKAACLFVDPDGMFPNHEPNPLLENATRSAQQAVLDEKADIGIIFDGDADRCGFVDERGRRISNDKITALVAQYLLSKHKGAVVLYDLRSSRVVPEMIQASGGQALRTRVGHSFIKEKMREEKAIFAGELSGHFYYKDAGYTDNAILTMIHMLNLLALKQKPLSELVGPLEKYYQSGEINFEIEDKEGVLQTLSRQYRDAVQDRLDGLTIQYPDWWFNLRPSNTEPLLRLNLEAIHECLFQQKKQEVLERIRAIVQKAKSAT